MSNGLVKTSPVSVPAIITPAALPGAGRAGRGAGHASPGMGRE